MELFDSSRLHVLPLRGQTGYKLLSHEVGVALLRMRSGRRLRFHYSITIPGTSLYNPPAGRHLGKSGPDRVNDRRAPISRRRKKMSKNLIL